MSRLPGVADGPDSRAVSRGLFFGALGVTMFAMTLPMTRLAVGDAAAPQLSPGFVTAGRAAVAGLLSVAYLLLLRAPRPRQRHWLPLAVCAAGTTLGFPLFLALALREVSAVHAAVVTGVLPLGTAVVAALVLRQRPSAGFWACAVAGCALVVGYAWQVGGGQFKAADGWLLLAVMSTSFGYVAGARVAQDMPAQQVICWVLVLVLPLSLPLALWLRPDAPVSTGAWLGFAYVSLFSMWLGFFAWYHGLNVGGVVRVSQVQLLQPFLALMFAVPVLGERLDGTSVLFCAAVLAVVLLGRRMPVGVPGDARPPRAG